MCAQQSDSCIKEALKTLCCKYGWSYGVFWRFDQRNSLLLTMQEAYYEEQMGVVIDDMLLQVHMLGGGIIGQAAFTKKHRWMFSDDHSGVSRDMFEDDSEFHRQFASGIKTIAVVPGDLGGVIQFGSTQKILERTGFVHQTKSLFQELENSEGLMLSENAPSCSNRESHGLSGFFAPFISSGNLCPVELKSLDSMHCQDLKGTACSSSNPSQSLSFASEQRSLPLTYTNSYHPDNQFHSADSDAQQPLLQSSTLFNCSTETPCSHIWSSADSSASFKGRPSDQECSIGFSAKSRGCESCLDTVQKVQNSTLESLHSTEKLFDLEKASLHTAGNLKSKQHSSMLLHETESELLETPINLCAFEELFPAFDYNTDLPKSCPVDNFSDWFAPSLDQKNEVAVTLNDGLLSQAMGLNSAKCNFIGGYTAIPIGHPANSVRSSITNVFSFDGKEKCSSISKVENDLFDCLGQDFGCKLARDWDEILMPVVNGGQLDFSADTSECISEQRVGSTFGPRKGLFSKLGIEQLLDGNTGVAKTVSGSSFEDQLSSTTKRRRTERTSGSCDQLQLAGLPSFSQKLTSLQPVYNIDRTNNFGPIKEVIPKSEAGSWTGENFSVNGESAVSDPKRRVELVKATKKKAKPGSRPRPKDRQQIHDRMSELRELIPNGEKLTIDCLLDRTIKHMHFLQSVTKHADRLIQTGPKEDGEVDKDKSPSTGVTWACELEDQTMVCPLIVEDLSTPGQMLIEMLCEEQGYFLEIVDIIRGFGLIILKGVMEVRENKIWAHYVVETEGTRHVTRHEIFPALVQLLQLTGPNGMETSNQCGNPADGGTPLLSNYERSVVPLPFSLAEALQCTSL